MFEKWNKQINVNEYLDEIAKIEANGGRQTLKKSHLDYMRLKLKN